MAALPQDMVTDLTRRVADLEQRIKAISAERDEALAQQSATADVFQVINSSPADLAPVFDAILERAMRLCEAPIGVLWSYDGEYMRASASRGAPPAYAEFLERGPIRPSHIQLQLLDRSDGFVQVADLALTEGYRIGDPLPRAAADLGGIRTLLVVSLRKHGVLLGTFGIYRQEVRPFSDRQVALVQSFAVQAVIAMENARLFNEAKEALERQTATADILKVIASSPSDVQPVFEAVVERAMSLLDCWSVIALRFDGEKVDFAAARGALPNTEQVVREFYRARRPNALLDQSLRERTIMSCTDALADPDPEARDYARKRGLRAYIIVPLLRDDGAEGALILTRAEPGLFAPREIELIQTFADQAVIAIENARLFNETREALERETSTAEILQVISSSPTDVQPVFDAIVASLLRLFGTQFAAVQLLRNGIVTMPAVGGKAGFERLAERFPRPLDDTTIGGLVMQCKQTRQFVAQEDSSTPGGTQRFARDFGFNSVMFTPMIHEGEVIGSIGTAHPDAKVFDPQQISLIETFARQAVIAIQNVRLFKDVQAKTADLQESLQQQTATADVLKVISRSAFDLQTVFNTLIDSAVALSGALSGTICLRDGDGYRYVATSSDMQSDFAKWLFEHPPTNGRASAAGRVLVSGKVEEVPDILEDPDYTLPVVSLNKTRSVIGVPLLGKDRLEGVLAMTRTEPGHFTQRQIELVQTFADQAVIAIENVRLFDEVQARTKELAASLDELRTAQDRLVQTEKLASLGQLTAGIAHEIKNPLNFVNNFSALSAELTDELNDVLKPVVMDRKVREDVDEITGLLKDNLEKVVQHGKRADSIVKNMLLHSREGAGEQRPADINALLDESLNLAYHGARAEKPGFNITLQRDFDPVTGLADVYPQEITRVLLNLIANGFYAATRRAADSGDGFEPTLRAATKNLGDRLEIRIRDNGTGMTPDVKEKIFNPFFTTKPAGEGTGLGLSMSHDIVVKQHGGTIDVVSEPGIFTEFIITLPRTITPQKTAGGTI